MGRLRLGRQYRRIVCRIQSEGRDDRTGYLQSALRVP
jgi:hypothetical protein